ncbi:MAG: hypothetical protein LUP95_04905 [Euryarchaeota archaeon]|nr:hypothetical protein [Euryarchaeota archaeon]
MLTFLFALEYVHRNAGDIIRTSRALGPPTVYIALMYTRMPVMCEGALITRSAWSRDGFCIALYKRIVVSHSLYPRFGFDYLSFIAFKVFCALLVAGKIRYRYAMRILTTPCITTITTAVVTRRVVYFGTVAYKAAMLGHLACLLCLNNSKNYAAVV